MAQIRGGEVNDADKLRAVFIGSELLKTRGYCPQL